MVARAASNASQAAFTRALGGGNVAAALAVVEGERSAGRSFTEIATEIIGPAQVIVGERWQTAAWTVAQEHAASAISEAVLHLLGGSLPESHGERPPVVLTCAENEWHTIPALLAATSLREAGWRVVYLGASMPAEHLAGFLTANRPLALAISCSLPLNLPGVRRQVAEAHLLGIPVVAGGRAFDSAGRRATALGLDAVANAGTDVNALLERWLSDAPQLASPVPGPAAAVAERLRSEREALAAGAFRILEAELPSIAAYDLRQRTRTLEDLAYTLDFLTTALDLDDPSILAEYIEWLSDLLTHRRVPPSALGKSMEALVRAVAHLPPAQLLLAGVAADYELKKSTVSSAATSSPTRPGRRLARVARTAFENVVPTIRSELERRASINAGALAVAEAVAGIDDPLTVAAVFTRTVGEELALTTAVVMVPATGEAATLGASDDPVWARHPAHFLPDVIAALAAGRPKGFRVAGREALAVPVAAGPTIKVALVAVSLTQTAASDAALAMTVLAKVLGPALRAANLEQDNRAKTAFLSVIGHELRTPLTSVMGFAGLLESDGTSDLNERQMHHVRRIRAGGTRLMALIEDVIDLVELESGVSTNRAEIFPLKSLLSDVAATAEARDDGVTVTVRCAAELAVETRRRNLARALGNIVENAVQFSPKGGIVRIAVRRGRKQTVIHVRDRGPGMDPAQVAQLGQPFLQLSRGFTRTHDGLGLGLTAARAHLLAVGARLEIRSWPGQGTDVAVILPTAAVAPKPAGREADLVRR